MAEPTTRVEELIAYLRARADAIEEAVRVEVNFADDAMTVEITRFERFRRRRPAECLPVMD